MQNERSLRPLRIHLPPPMEAIKGVLEGLLWVCGEMREKKSGGSVPPQFDILVLDMGFLTYPLEAIFTV